MDFEELKNILSFETNEGEKNESIFISKILFIKQKILYTFSENIKKQIIQLLIQKKIKNASPFNVLNINYKLMPEMNYMRISNYKMKN